MRRPPKSYRRPGLSPGRAAAIKHLVERLTAELGRALSDQEVASALAMSPARVARHRDALAKGRRT